VVSFPFEKVAIDFQNFRITVWLASVGFAGISVPGGESAGSSSSYISIPSCPHRVPAIESQNFSPSSVDYYSYHR
jgi:hypothetical protein